MRIRKGLFCLVALGSVLAGCAEPTSVADEACLAMVNVGGTEFTTLGEAVDAGLISAEPVATVSALQPECFDTIEPGQNTTGGSNLLRPGESNFLPAGTPLHAITGFGVEERLAYRDSDGAWQVLVAVTE